MLQSLLDLVFLNSPLQLAIFAAVVVLAGMVRGCLGFGFSAVVVGFTSFWLPPAAVVSMLVLLEIAASLSMAQSVRRSADYSLLIPMALGALPLSLIGVWLLAHLPDITLRIMISLYLGLISLLGLLDYTYRGILSRPKLFSIGMLAGFFNGLASIGGMSMAMFLVAAQRPVAQIRATMVMFFLLSEAIFLFGAWLNDIYTWEIALTTITALPSMWLGLWLGTRLFHRLPEWLLKRILLSTLVGLALFGIAKNLPW